MNRVPAGFWPRLAAFALDYLVIAAYAVLLFLIIELLRLAGLVRSASALPGHPALFDLFAFLILVLPVSLYFALSESSSYQATWGKRRMGLRVSGMGELRISLPRSLLRSGVKFLPWQIAHTSLFHIPGWPLAVQQIPPGSILGFAVAWGLVSAYLLLLAFGRSHRTPYDWLARTIVEKISPKNEVCRMAFTPIPIHVSAVIRDPQGRCLFVQEGEPDNLGEWNLPGGHLEKMETLQSAAKREALEETGLTVSLTGLVGVYTNIRPPDRHTLRFVFYAECAHPRPAPGPDILGVDWKTLEEFFALPDDSLTSPVLLHKIFADVQDGKRFSLEVLRE